MAYFKCMNNICFIKIYRYKPADCFVQHNPDTLSKKKEIIHGYTKRATVRNRFSSFS